MTELKLLGPPDIGGPDLSPQARVRRRHPLALLALAAWSGPRGIGRDRIMAFLWPESDGDRASNSLRQTLFLIRNELGEGVFLPETAGSLQINPSEMTVDLWRFRDAIQRKAPEEAVELYRGPFMDGFQIPGGSEFARWVDAERDRLTRQHVDALEALAQQAHAEGRFDTAVSWRRRQAGADPFSSRAALGLLRALAAADDRTGALEYAAIYENLVRLHLEVDPDPAVLEFVAALRTMPIPARQTGRTVRTVQPPDETPQRTSPGPAGTALPTPRRRSVPWRSLTAVAALLVVALAIVGLADDGETKSPVADAVIVLGSGMAPMAGRDTANRLIACEGVSCPSSTLPQPAYLLVGHPMHASPAPGTGYIAHVADGTTTPSPGYECCTKATFEQTFTLPSNAFSASISISVVADNQAIVFINGVEFGRQPNEHPAENYAGPAAVFTATFPPDPSGLNRLHVTLICGGGAVALNYRAIITYDARAEVASAELTPG